MAFSFAEGGVTFPEGFSAASAAAGIKYKGRTDMAMIVCDVPCECAGVYTSNIVKAACVQWDRKITSSGGPLQAVVINSGIANACTGQDGFDACEATASAVTGELGIPYTSVAVASTGVIGMKLPVDRLQAGVKEMAGKLSSSAEAGTAASKAIMTTDTVNKEVAVTFTAGGKTVKIGGMGKGSGMIHPNMCTMLGFITTDAVIDHETLALDLKAAADRTFNMITVDGDTSTNDTLIIMASGLAGNEKILPGSDDHKTFVEALEAVCRFLARRMAGDGEGATKLFTAKVVNAKSEEDAKLMAKAIVGSNLSKAAIFGCDANFGRFLCAMGYSGAEFDQADVELYFESDAGKLKVFEKGDPLGFDEDEAVRIMKETEVIVTADMNEGSFSAEAWGCDLTYDYVKINADYRS